MEILTILFYALLWMVFNSMPVWYVIYTEKRLMPDPVRDKGFEPWIREDRPRWSYCFALFTAFFGIPRFLLGWGCITGTLVASVLADWRTGPHEQKKPLNKYSQMFISFWFCVFGRLHDLSSGCVWFTVVKRVKVDYSYWLGPDYEYTYDKAGIHVLNHLGMQDIIHSIHLRNFGGYSSSFIAKKEMKSWPILPRLIEPLDSLCVGRDKKDSQAEIDNVMVKIKERQLLAEQGKARPLTIFPEGCSTSGEYVINFKKGAFHSLRKVKPFSAKTWSPDGLSANSAGCLTFLKQNFAHCLMTCYTYTVQEMPDFEPNEYFWKHHWDGKESKWKPFSRAVRQLIAEQNNLKLSNCWTEDKMKYKQVLKESLKKQQ